MFAASTIIGGIGLAVGAFGAYENYEGTSAAASANADAAKQQAAIAQIQAGNVDTQEAELNLQTNQSDLQIATNKSVIGLQQQSADIQQQAASLDVTRQIRQQIRNGIVASGTSLNAAADSGATGPGGTAVKQAQANIQGQTNNNILSLNQNFEVGTDVYNINKQITNTQLQAQDQNASYVDQSQTLQTTALENQRKIYQLGGTASLDYASAASAGGTAALGSGLLAVGTGLANSSNKIGQLTQYFTGNNTTQGSNPGYTAQTYGNGQT